MNVLTFTVSVMLVKCWIRPPSRNQNYFLGGTDVLTSGPIFLPFLYSTLENLEELVFAAEDVIGAEV